MPAVEVKREYSPVSSVSLGLGDHRVSIRRLPSLLEAATSNLTVSFDSQHGELYRGHTAAVKVGEIREFVMGILELLAQLEAKREA